MRGINVRKIAAFAGVTVLGLAAINVADVVYGSTQLVDQAGQPTVKIFVGSKAAISDGVAAANIAAKIANEAYKSSTLTAQVSGTPACTVGAGVGGSGTCSIVESSKKVTLEVTVPGTIAGTHEFKTLITDTIDRTPQNRINSLSEDNYTTGVTSADTGGSLTSPLRGVEDGTKGTNLYRIGSGQFNAFSDFSVVDNQATSATYTEEQNFWIGSSTNGVQYDSSSSIRDIAVNKYTAMVYNAKFTGNDFGIPVCTGDLASNDSTNWASCASDSNSRTDRHRLKIKFLGAEWIVSEMTNPTATLNSSTNALKGGQVKLAKEAKYGIVNVGQVLDAGTFKIRLSDISVNVGSDNKHPAIIDVLDANDAVVGQIQVDPGSTYTFTQSGTGNSVKIHVYKTAPGFTLNAKWAEMAIYSDEITLKDGSRYNLVSSTDTDKNFKVSLLWKNKDWSSGSDSLVADSLREIVIFNTDGFTEKTKPGDVTNFLAANPVFKLTYNGLDLTDDDYLPLTYTALSADSYRVATSSGDVSCGATSSIDSNYANAKLIEIRTSGASKLGGTGDALSGDYLFERVLWDPIGSTSAGAAVNFSGTANSTGNTLPGSAVFTTQSSITITSTNMSGTISILPRSGTTFDLNTTSNATQIGWISIPASNLGNTSNFNASYNQNTVDSAWSSTVFWKVSGRDCYNFNTVSTVAVGSEVLGSNGIKLEEAGQNSAAQGQVFFASSSTASGFQRDIVLSEDAGKNTTSTTSVRSNTKVYTAIPVLANTSSYSTHRFRLSDSATQQVYYRGLAGPSFTAYEPTFVSERGSKTQSVGTSDASIWVARKIGMPTFHFAAADTSAASTGDEYVLGVGESRVFGGVTVKAKAIDMNGGSCTVLTPGGTPACTVDSASLNAVLQPNNAASVVVTEPFALQSKLVMQDTDGSAAGVAILVGGPAVNDMTASALVGSEVNFDVDTVVVKEVGNKIVVAGKTAGDTMAAADQFIAGIKRQ